MKDAVLMRQTSGAATEGGVTVKCVNLAVVAQNQQKIGKKEGDVNFRRKK